MGFTTMTLIGTFENADGSAADGMVQLQLDQPMSNDEVTIERTPIQAVLNSSGAFSVPVVANDDPGTQPTGATYTVVERVSATSAQEYSIVVSEAGTATENAGSTTANSETVTLSSLKAVATMVGKAISGTNIPAGATVTGYNAGANTVTISAPATGSASGLTLEVGGVVSLADLRPGAPGAG